MNGKCQEELAKTFWKNSLKSKQLQNALEALNFDAQKALYLRFWESMSIDEIARELKIEWKDADLLLTNSIKILRSHMKDTKATSHDGAA